MKKMAIMQPYFLPYIGYWQLINAVDEFVVYDNIQFTKKGWVNRNRILDNGHDRLFTIPIKKDSDFLNVDQRYLSDDSREQIKKILRFVEILYKKAPNFGDAFPVIENCFQFPDDNLFEYIQNSINIICGYLGIQTPITRSSHVQADHSLKAEKRVIAICKAQSADVYVNAIGGQELYDRNEFKKNEIDLKFLKSGDIKYRQFDSEFVPWLSILDVMMFNDSDSISKMLAEYELV